MEEVVKEEYGTLMEGVTEAVAVRSDFTASLADEDEDEDEDEGSCSSERETPSSESERETPSRETPSSERERETPISESERETPSPKKRRIQIQTLDDDEKRTHEEDEEHDIVEVSKEFYENEARMNQKYRKEILLFSAPPVALDTSGGITLSVDVHQLREQGAHITILQGFLVECLNRNTLQIYDHPGDNRCDGFLHWEKPSMTAKLAVKNVADFAIKRCRTLLNKETLRLSSVDKLSLKPAYHRFYYLTFTVVDEDTDEETTFQAEILEITFNHFVLGLLRDPSRDRVIAVMQLEGTIDDDDDDDDDVDADAGSVFEATVPGNP